MGRQKIVLELTFGSSQQTDQAFVAEFMWQLAAEKSMVQSQQLLEHSVALHFLPDPTVARFAASASTASVESAGLEVLVASVEFAATSGPFQEQLHFLEPVEPAAFGFASWLKLELAG